MLTVVRDHYDIRGVQALNDAIQAARETGRTDDDLFRELKQKFKSGSFSPTAIQALFDAVDELQKHRVLIDHTDNPHPLALATLGLTPSPAKRARVSLLPLPLGGRGSG